ncbi:MAG: hypothetical protein P8K78_06410 [Pirellulales bacterium]|nr:hypothetical protein [Pirellulales bacterium]
MARSKFRCHASETISEVIFRPQRDPNIAHRLQRAEAAYTAAQECREPQQAVDHYYESVVWSWIFICRYHNEPRVDLETDRAWDIYHSSLAKLITVGQEAGRLNLRQGLLVRNPSGMEVIPIHFKEFHWPQGSFNKLVTVGCYRDSNLKHQYRACGLGVPLVAIQKNKCSPPEFTPFFLQHTPFAATCILYPNLQPWTSTVALPSSPPVASGLTLYDPQKVETVQYENTSFRLAADITAPLGYLGQETNWNTLEEFSRPETDPKLAGLRMLEPYQAEKIPILFVHGLFSDPQTYLEMANRIRACPELTSRYQIWVFRYPTGGNFFLSAAKLRQQLASLAAQCEAKGTDRHLREMVIVGHSLGGLVAKLQVTSSGSTLWNNVARVPLDQVVATPTQREQLRSEFFFAASPYIKTAIFIAVPNEGSPWAHRPVGKIASHMVKYSPQQAELHRTLMQQNPNVFHPDLQKRIPTSVDLMNPDNQLLQAIQKIPLAPWAQSYAIAGTGGSALSRMGPSDGVVTLRSATTPAAGQTYYVDAIHTDILRNSSTIDIVTQILRNQVSLGYAPVSSGQ